MQADFPEPDSTKVKLIRDFMRDKYVNKRWLDNSEKELIENGVTNTSTNQEPLNNVLGNDIPPLKVESESTSIQPISGPTEIHNKHLVIFIYIFNIYLN